MTATNHALTGSLIGFSIVNPFVALPLAVLSHFICDAIPHYGAGAGSEATKNFRRLLLADMSLCLALVAVLIALQPVGWLIAAVCAFLATSPDLMWIKKFWLAQRGEVHSDTQKTPLILKFHAAIQWFEKPIGSIVEIAWALAALLLLKVYII